MAIVYFDSSALVKLVLDEAGSDVAAALWNACDAALSNRLALDSIESVSPAALVERIGALSGMRIREICQALEVAVDCRWPAMGRMTEPESRM